MDKQQKNEVLKGIYAKAVDTILKAVDNRQQAVHNYETYLETVEKTIKVFNPEFDLDRDLKLVPRGLNDGVLRYVTSLDMDSQREQLDFYRDTKNRL